MSLNISKHATPQLWGDYNDTKVPYAYTFIENLSKKLKIKHTLSNLKGSIQHPKYFTRAFV